MKVYKILHRPTGLFFAPSKGYGNLSKNGKIYTTAHRLEWAGCTIRIILKPANSEKLLKHQQIIVDYFGLEKIVKTIIELISILTVHLMIGKLLSFNTY